jgi:squalene-associated FAD-dependent desaturase
MPAISTQSSVSIVGGGVAGLAAACALADAGYRVDLFERRGYVGGRASSYLHPGTGEIIDNSQHVLVGCCTNLIDLYRRIGVEDQIRWYDNFTFVEPGGRRSIIGPSMLPAPLHTAPAFLRAHAFTLADKSAIARGLRAFLRGIPDDSGETFADWLVRHRQTKAAVRRFWRPVLISALNEDAENISAHYAGMVIREVFLRSPAAGRMGVPMIPLSDLYARAIDYIQARGGRLHQHEPVDSLNWHEDRRTWTLTAGDQAATSDMLVLALSFEGTAKLLPLMPLTAGVSELASALQHFEHSPITAVHLWFDREITDLDHAVLLDSKVDWMYHASRLQPQRNHGEGSYMELIFSASRWLTPQSREQIIEMATGELARFFPRVREAALRKAAVVKEVRATFSCRPMLDHIRPTQTSPWPNAFLAGDWTSTGWPATMEGAARSGYLAAEALTAANGAPQKFLRPDLPSAGLMKFFD